MNKNKIYRSIAACLAAATLVAMPITVKAESSTSGGAFSYLRTCLTAVSVKISALSSKMTKAESRIDELEKRLEALEADNAALMEALMDFELPDGDDDVSAVKYYEGTYSKKYVTINYGDGGVSVVFYTGDVPVKTGSSVGTAGLLTEGQTVWVKLNADRTALSVIYTNKPAE